MYGGSRDLLRGALRVSDADTVSSFSLPLPRPLSTFGALRRSKPSRSGHPNPTPPPPSIIHNSGIRWYTFTCISESSPWQLPLPFECTVNPAPHSNTIVQGESNPSLNYPQYKRAYRCVEYLNYGSAAGASLASSNVTSSPDEASSFSGTGGG